MMNRRSTFFSSFSNILSAILLAGLLAACSSPQAVVPIPQTGSTSLPTAAQPARIQPAAPGSPVAVGASPCTSPAALTPAVTEGPYFKAGSPERASLVDAGMPGTRLTISGTVYTTDCKPVAGAKLDFWQANAQGQYDNSGYTLRGHLFTDANGHYQLETIVPGEYPGRTEHIHVKVQAPNGPLLTTQLFFPGVADNQSDGIFDPRLVMSVQDGPNGSKVASFDFVVQG
jgi:protocatechuate 3,4-dioxygenase beta subunit